MGKIIRNGEIYAGNSTFTFHSLAAAQAALQAGELPEYADVQIIPLDGEGNAQPFPAELVGYDNTESGLDAENVQDAIDEVNKNVNSTKIVKLFNTLQTSTITAIPGDFKKYNRIDIKLYSTNGYSSVGSFFPSLEGDVYENSNYSVSVFVFNITDPDNSMQGYFYVTTNSGVIPYNLNLVLHDPASMFLGYQVFGCYNG